MYRPGGGLYRALAVADVDLDRRSVTPVAPSASGDSPVEGVHALVWFHGEPIGELTVPGDPQTVMAALPDVAERELLRPVVQHLLRDALAAPAGVAHAVRSGLTGVGHADRVPVDGSELTVAVCTRDRPDHLRRCLAALARLETPPAEVLVIDNASLDDSTRMVTEEFGFRWVREPRAGLDWARNRALLEATTRIVAFTDDDVLVHPLWTRGILRAFQEEPDAVAVTGLVAPAELATPAQVQFEALGGFGRGYARKWMSVAVEDGEVAAQLYPGTGGAGTGANMAFLREHALALGGFDPALDVGTRTGGGGDLEMYFRVLAAGGLLVYEPSAVVRHVHRRTMAELRRQVRGNGTGNYSILAGAGLRYGRVHALSLQAFACRWAIRYHLRSLVRSLLRPRTWPRSLAWAEIGGMAGAVLRRYYAQARAQAAQQSARHPAEPQTPPLRRARPIRRLRRSPDPVVDIDVSRDCLVEGEQGLRLRGHRRRRRLRVRVLRCGRPQADLTIRTGGSLPSAARLRWELADRLGPAILVPGVSWAEVLGGAAVTVDDVSRALTDHAAPSVARQVPAPTVTVVTVTRNPAAVLERFVPAQLSTGPRALEVVVVDISVQPTDDGAALASPPGVRVVRAPGLGPVQARNAAVGELSGEVAVFVDDDVVPTAGWIDALLEPFRDPTVSAVTGNILPSSRERLDCQLLEDLGRLGGAPHRHEYDRRWARRARGAMGTWWIASMGNTAIRATALHGLGPLSAALAGRRGDARGAEAEYFYRMLRSGGRVVHQPMAVVLRDEPATRQPLGRWVRETSAWRVAYHLELLFRYGDLRGAARLAMVLPRHYLRRARRILSVRDDFPAGLLLADAVGSLTGLATWVGSTWRRR